jgi:hypothetical protein
MSNHQPTNSVLDELIAQKDNVSLLTTNIPEHSIIPPTVSRDQYRANIYRALVPNGGVACFLTNASNVLHSQSNHMNNKMTPMKFEYAALPTIPSRSIWNESATNQSDMTLLQLCIRLNNHETTMPFNNTTTNAVSRNVDVPTCRVPIRQPEVSATAAALNWYSNETHVSAFTLPPLIQRQLFSCRDDKKDPSNVPIVERLAVLRSCDANAHPIPMANSTFSDDHNAAHDIVCQPQVPFFGCIGENVHRFVQKLFSNVSTNFVSVPPQ